MVPRGAVGGGGGGAVGFVGRLGVSRQTTPSRPETYGLPGPTDSAVGSGCWSRH